MTKLLGELPASFPIPILVVQHRSKDSERLLVQLLQDVTDLKVGEIEDKDPLFVTIARNAPYVDVMRDDPRFQALVATLNFADFDPTAKRAPAS